jgi:hypothetical protein
VNASTRNIHRRIALGSAAAVCAIALLSACGDDDSPSEDPAGGEVDDNPEGVTDGGSTIVDPDVPASNLANEPESPLDPGASPAT